MRTVSPSISVAPLHSEEAISISLERVQSTIAWPSYRMERMNKTASLATARIQEFLIWTLTTTIPARYSAMKKLRISIEWNYATTGALFKYLAMPWKLRLMRSSTVSKIYTVCTIVGG